MKNYKDCSMCQRWLESHGNKPRVAREFWIDIDHSMSGPMEVLFKPEQHAIHVKEVWDESFSASEKRAYDQLLEQANKQVEALQQIKGHLGTMKFINREILEYKIAEKSINDWQEFKKSQGL